MVAAEPQRGMRSLHGLGLHADVIEMEELAGERHLRLGPQRLHDAQPFGEPGGAARGRQADRGVHARVPAEPDARDEAPSTELIDGRQHLGEMDRTAQRAQEHRRSQPQMRRVSRGIREEDDGLETGHPTHDLLDDPRAVKSKRFGSSQHLADSPGLHALGHERLRNGNGQLDAPAHAAERYQGGATVYSEQPARDSRRGASMSGVKDAIARALDRAGDELEQLSRKIHDHPELGYQEVKASGWLA